MTNSKNTTEWCRLLCLIPVFLTLVHSCTEVSLNVTAEEYETERPVKIRFDWTESNLEPGDRPDSLLLIFDCIADSTRCSFNVCADSAATNEVLLPKNGEWICFVANEKVQGMSLDGLNKFLHIRDTFSLKTITARADTMTYSELTSIRGFINTNPGMPYLKEIKGNVSSLGRVRVNGVSESTLILALKDLSVNVNFKLKLKIEEGVTVERMVGEISGVPGVINLMNKEVVASNMGKTLFGIHPNGADSSRWNGSVRISGIIPPEKNDIFLGDGILTLRIYVTTEREKMLYVTAMNLKTLLENKPVLVPTDRSGIYHCSGNDNFVLDIPATLWLTPAGVKPCGDGQGTNEWNNGEKFSHQL